MARSVTKISSKIGKLKRVMDLFVEGAVCDLGEDIENSPGTRVLVWVNKPNSFEEDEARKDGLVARAIRLAQLGDPEDPMSLAYQDSLSGLTRDELLDQVCQAGFEDDYLTAMNDVEAMPEWNSRMETLRRGAEILRDRDAADDDPAWKTYNDLSSEYMETLRKRLEALQGQRRADYSKSTEAELQQVLMEAFKARTAMDDFLGEKRITELFYAIRDCSATGDVEEGYDHRSCDHSLRLLERRDEVRSLPEQFLQKVNATLTALEVDARTAGNSVAPGSSSESSEQQSKEEDSNPSTQEGTSSGARTT